MLSCGVRVHKAVHTCESGRSAAMLAAGARRRTENNIQLSTRNLTSLQVERDALAHTGGGAQANVQMFTKEGFVDYAATNSNKHIDPEAMANAIARYLVCARVRESACLRARAHFEVREYLRCTSMQVGT